MFLNLQIKVNAIFVLKLSHQKSKDTVSHKVSHVYLHWSLILEKVNLDSL